MTESVRRGTSAGRVAAGAVAAWFLYVAVDFLTHGVVLAWYWKATAEYWRPPEELFRLIPLSYAAFAILCGVLAWLMARLYGEKLNVATGARFGLIAGLLYSGTGAVGTYCAFRMPASALFYWPVSGTVLAVAACTTAAWTMTGPRPWRRVALSIVIAFVLLVLGVVAQNVFVPRETFRP
jgi:hypothetical protein